MDRYSKKRALLIVKYITGWEWHFRLNGTMWIRDLDTGQVIEVGRIE